MNLNIIVLAKQVPDTRNVGKDAMNADGTINIINLLDRAAGYDQITQNGSWYNPTTGVVHFDFIILGWSAPGGGGGAAVEEGNEAGYLYCYDFTPAAE